MSKREKGMALIGVLVLLTLGASWWLVSALSAPVNRTALERAHNAKVLSQAKAALIGYVAHKAAISGENDPGSIPCPEAAGNIGTANEGIAAGNCTLPAVGRLPWRTLGLPKLFDAAGEPLWYVASSGWAKPNAATNTVINSSCTEPLSGMACWVGQFTVDGVSNAAVALFIAPGRPLQVAASANCAARNQTRSIPSSSIDLRDYLECHNATSPANTVFATSGPDGSFNDQVLLTTADELLPGIEAAVGTRLAREFGPSMRYCAGLWPACTGAGSAVYLPFAASFGNPAISNFRGVVNNTQGLLPLSFSAVGGCDAVSNPPFCNPPLACDPALDNRCATALVTYRNNPVITRTGGVTLTSYSCSVAGTPSMLTCTLNTSAGASLAASDRWMTFTMDVTSNNVGMAVRTINAAVRMTGIDTDVSTAVNYPYGYATTAATMNADGSATIRLNSRVRGESGGLVGDLVCGLSGMLGLLSNCFEHTITLPFIWVDQPMLYANNATLAWFYRNNWHQHMYYAVSAGNAPNGTGTCTAGTTCLSITGPSVTNVHRSLVVVPGRAVVGQVRPPAAISDWLEGGNANLDAAFWARDPALAVNRAFNDHIVPLDSN